MSGKPQTLVDNTAARGLYKQMCIKYLDYSQDEAEM